MYCNGSEWLRNLPNLPGASRDQMILDAAASGLLYAGWKPVTSSLREHKATFYVSEDAFYVTLDNGQRFRPQCNAVLLQKVADVVGGSLVTPKIMDLSYQQADVKLNATILSPTNMMTTEKSILFNKEFEKKRAGRIGLIRDCGKTWVLTNQLGLKKNQAINYGFYDTNGPSRSNLGLKLWQWNGTRHDSSHQDYSQLITLMADVCLLNGQEVPVAELLTNKEFAGLGSFEIPLRFTRQP